MAKASETVLLSHILSQTQANVSFLAAHDYLSATDASDIITRLTGAQTKITANGTLANDMRALTVAAPAESRAAVPPPVRRNIPPPPSRTQKARALWTYNENGQEPNDLSFSSGEIIEIIDETNADWWTGKCRGRQGLFPSNHVEKIDTPATSPPSVSPVPTPSPWAPSPMGMPMVQMPPQPPYQPVNYGSEKPVYRPFGAAYHGAEAPPPNPVGLQQEEHKEKKKSKFGGLGNTMANSAAGGVGFGAGAAIGSGLVNAIF